MAGILSDCAGPMTPTNKNCARHFDTCPGDTVNCGDFGTRRVARNWFNTYYQYVGDVAKLDANKDRIACESLPGQP
jgi:hypothetical protein